MMIWLEVNNCLFTFGGFSTYPLTQPFQIPFPAQVLIVPPIPAQPQGCNSTHPPRLLPDERGWGEMRKQRKQTITSNKPHRQGHPDDPSPAFTPLSLSFSLSRHLICVGERWPVNEGTRCQPDRGRKNNQFNQSNERVLKLTAALSLSLSRRVKLTHKWRQRKISHLLSGKG